jgi:hypothetical protein
VSRPAIALSFFALDQMAAAGAETESDDLWWNVKLENETRTVGRAS